MTAAAQLHLLLDVPGGDAQEVEQDVQRLRRELLALDVEDVRPPAGGPAPPGARSPGAAELGALVVTLLGTPGLLPVTIATIRDWLGRRPDRTVEITLDGDTLKLTGASREEQKQLVGAWLSRHQ